MRESAGRGENLISLPFAGEVAERQARSERLTPQSACADSSPVKGSLIYRRKYNTTR